MSTYLPYLDTMPAATVAESIARDTSNPPPSLTMADVDALFARHPGDEALRAFRDAEFARRLADAYGNMDS